MVNLKCPCSRDCQDRSAECRITCERYKEYEKEYFEKVEEHKNAKERESDCYTFHRGQISKSIIFKRVKR